MEEIAAAQSTIELLLPQGDFAGALDVLDSMRATCETHPVTGLHAFQHLSSQITDIAEARSLPSQCLKTLVHELVLYIGQCILQKSA